MHTIHILHKTVSHNYNVVNVSKKTCIKHASERAHFKCCSLYKSTINYHWIWICYEIPQRIQKSLVFHHLGIDIMELCHTDCCCFPNIGVFIFQALAEGFTEIFCDLVYPNAPHGSNCQRSNQRIRIFTILPKKKEKATVWIQDDYK